MTTLEDQALNLLSNSFNRSERVNLVLRLADRLGVMDEICTVDTAEKMAERRVREAREDNIISDGQRVHTPAGEARAVLVSETDLAAIRRVLEVAHAA